MKNEVFVSNRIDLMKAQMFINGHGVLYYLTSRRPRGRDSCTR